MVAELAAACADATSLFGAKLGALELAVNWVRWGKSIDGHEADYKYMTCQCNIYIFTYIYTYINKTGNQIQLELNLNLIPPLWLPTVGHVLKEFNLNLILWLCCVLVPDPSFFFYIG